MHHHDTNAHGPAETIVTSDMGSVSTCSCGIVTVTLQYLSLRFEPAAFRAFQGLLTVAQHRLDGERTSVRHSPMPADAPPVH